MDGFELAAGRLRSNRAHADMFLIALTGYGQAQRAGSRGARPGSMSTSRACEHRGPSEPAGDLRSGVLRDAAGAEGGVSDMGTVT